MGKSGRHKRGKPGHGGHQGGSKRRHLGGGGRRRTSSGWGPEIESDDDGPGGTLHIGGVVVRVDSAGNGIAQTLGSGHQRQRRRGSAGSMLAPPPPLRRQSGSSTSGTSDSEDGSSSDDEEARHADEAMEDYIANLGAGGSDDSGRSGPSSDSAASHSSGSQADVEEARSAGAGSAAKRRRQAYAQYEMLRRFSGFEMGDEGPPEDLRWPGFSSEEEDSSSSSDGSGSSSSGDGDGSSDSSGSSSSGSDSDSEGGSSSGEEDGWGAPSSEGGDELMEADLEQLSLAQRYPVQVRPRQPPAPGQVQSGKQAGSGAKGKKKSKSAVKGAKGGKLAPGEKKRLKREQMEAKRAARAASRGFDLAWINRQLEEFVARQGDMEVFGPLGKHEGKAVARLAAIYGCCASLQGSKSNRKLVVVSSTPRTCLPQGPDLLAIGQILAAQTAAERSGAAMDGRLAAAVAGADLSSVLPPALPAAGSGRGRWAGVQRGTGGPGGSTSGAKAKKKRSKLRPVAFVSIGAINPDDTVEVAMPTAPAVPDIAAEAADAAPGCDVGMAAEPGSELPVLEPVEAAEAAVLSPQQRRHRQHEVAAASVAVQLLQVVEDRQGDAASVAAGGTPEMAADAVGVPAAGPAGRQEGEEEAAYASDEASEEERTGLGSGGALYTRMTALSLQSPASPALAAGAATSPHSGRGSAAAEGITNPGRLLGLGLALGIGAEVFGAPGPAASPADMAADLSPLSQIGRAHV